jgi:murein DD-endopeptidase MepM/ murein hydrolase activator NlpD
MHIWKFVLAGFCFAILLFLILVGSITFYAHRLSLEDKVSTINALEEAWHLFTLPFKLAYLSSQPPEARLSMPVYGVDPDSVIDTWDAPRGEGRRHQGQDIFARRGTPVFAAVPGYVTRLGENTLGGNFVLATGAGGRRYYYAHLDSIAGDIWLGMPVGTTTVLGFVGTTGNASGTPPHLHFGIYMRGGAIDPLPLLREASTSTPPEVAEGDTSA